jgi:hypothetical protein
VTGRAELWLEVLGTSVHVVSDDGRMVDLIHELWEPFAVSNATRRAHEVAIETRSNGWYLDAAPDPPIVAADPWILAAEARNSIARRAVVETPLVPLHAAAAERDGTFVVLSGPPRAGKTTLLIDLVHDGWSVVTDDLVPIDPASLSAVPFPKPLSVRDPERWRRVAQGWKVPDWLPPPQRVGLVPTGAVRRTDVVSFSPSAFVFPQFVPGAEADFRRLSPAETIARCADNLHPQRPPTPEGLATLAKAGAAAPGFAGRYGSSEDALELLGKCLAGLESME